MLAITPTTPAELFAATLNQLLVVLTLALEPGGRETKICWAAGFPPPWVAVKFSDVGVTEREVEVVVVTLSVIGIESGDPVKFPVRVNAPL